MHKKSYFIHSVVLSSIVITLGTINIVNGIKKPQTVNIMISNKSSIEYWRQIISDYPTYKDAYLILASLELSQGNIATSDSLIEKARELDPNGDIILPEVENLQ